MRLDTRSCIHYILCPYITLDTRYSIMYLLPLCPCAVFTTIIHVYPCYNYAVAVICALLARFCPCYYIHRWRRCRPSLLVFSSTLSLCAVLLLVSYYIYLYLTTISCIYPYILVLYPTISCGYCTSSARRPFARPRSCVYVHRYPLHLVLLDLVPSCIYNHYILYHNILCLVLFSTTISSSPRSWV